MGLTARKIDLHRELELEFSVIYNFFGEQLSDGISALLESDSNDETNISNKISKISKRDLSTLDLPLTDSIISSVPESPDGFILNIKIL